eukprot:145365_1
MNYKKKIKKLAELVKKSKHFVVYTGAGISTSCGIADYRSGLNTVLDTGAGKWAKQAAHREGKLTKQAAKNVNTKKKKRISTFKAVPSASHMALVALAKAGIVKHLVSQNTDGLHRRSGFPIDLLSELHGNSTLEECSLCDKAYMRDFRCSTSKRAIVPTGVLAKIKYVSDEIKKGLQNNSKYYNFITNEDKEFMTLKLSETYNFIKQQKTHFAANNKRLLNEIKGIQQAKGKDKIMEENKEFRSNLLNNWKKVLNKAGFKLPRYLHHTGRFCAIKGCNGQLTDTIINFGESLHEKPLQDAENTSEKADLYLVLGSSCTVSPACNMPKAIGKKWKKEIENNNNNNKEAVHNLVICNIQKTPLHHLCSLPMHAKIDDVMCGLMKELGLTIPKWYLTRYMKICINDIGNRDDERKLCVSGVDRDGTGFTLFKSVVLRNNGERIRKIINNKENKEDEYNYIVPIWDIDDNDNDNEAKDNKN